MLRGNHHQGSGGRDYDRRDNRRRDNDRMVMTHGQATEFADLAETSDVPTRARPDLRLAGGERTVDMAAAQRAAGEFLAALGIELDAEDLRETPPRMARAYAELFDSPPLRLPTLPTNERYAQLVLARDIP